MFWFQKDKKKTVENIHEFWKFQIIALKCHSGFKKVYLSCLHKNIISTFFPENCSFLRRPNQKFMVQILPNQKLHDRKIVLQSGQNINFRMFAEIWNLKLAKLWKKVVFSKDKSMEKKCSFLKSFSMKTFFFIFSIVSEVIVIYSLKTSMLKSTFFV